MGSPFAFFDLSVVRTERIGRSLMRVTFGGEGLSCCDGGFQGGGRDQRIKVFLPHPGQAEPVVPAEAGEEWYARWREMDPEVRGVMRTYTVAAQRPGELDVDFAIHGLRGPASRWACAAAPGDRVTVLGPVEADNAGVDFRPPTGTEWVLLAGDESALPAIAAILAWLPEGTVVRTWIEVAHSTDVRWLPSAAEADITWLIRGGAQGQLLQEIERAVLPPGMPYAWIAGEAGTIRDLRRHLVRARAFDRRAVNFTGYWRRGASEEDLLAEEAG
jgi:NADPH-dependent ferric siderophore reductase